MREGTNQQGGQEELQAPEYPRVEPSDLFHVPLVGGRSPGDLAVPEREQLAGEQGREQADGIEVEDDLQAELETRHFCRLRRIGECHARWQ